MQIFQIPKQDLKEIVAIFNREIGRFIFFVFVFFLIVFILLKIFQILKFG